MKTVRPVTADLTWSKDLQFQCTSGRTSLVVDGDSTAGPSPVQLLVIALAACMSIDVMEILKKGRHTVLGCRSSVEAGRAPEAPRRLLSLTLHFSVDGDAPEAAVERAISLSRDRYCSVWHSLREDIDLTTRFDLNRKS